MIALMGWLAPLVIAIVWLVFIVLSRTSIIVEDGIRLSPVRNTAPLIFSLVIFIIGYLAFLAIMFSEELATIFHKKSAKKHE